MSQPVQCDWLRTNGQPGRDPVKMRSRESGSSAVTWNTARLAPLSTASLSSSLGLAAPVRLNKHSIT